MSTKNEIANPLQTDKEVDNQQLSDEQLREVAAARYGQIPYVSTWSVIEAPLLNPNLLS
jgi:hypothetical protein